MIPNTPIVLKGKAARDFERYQKTPATKEEIKYFKNSEKLYLKYCPENTNRRMTRLLICDICKRYIRPDEHRQKDCSTGEPVHIVCVRGGIAI